MPLPVNIDTTYADDGGDASVQLHQAHHDDLHGFFNLYEDIRPESWVAVQDASGGSTSCAVTGSYKDVEDNTGGGGTASARPLDVVIPDMQVGDAFVVRPMFSMSSASGGFLLNAAIYVAGSVVRRIFDDTFGYFPWSIPSGVAKDLADWSPKQIVQSGDLEGDGSLRVRFQYIQATAARALNTASTIPAWTEGRGPLV